MTPVSALLASSGRVLSLFAEIHSKELTTLVFGGVNFLLGKETRRAGML